MFLSSLGIRGTNFISVHNFPAQYRLSFGNQRNLNFRVMAVRGIKRRSRLLENTYLSCDLHLSNWKSAYLNVCLFSAVNQCPR